MFDPTELTLAALPSVAFEARRDLPTVQGIYFASVPGTMLYIGKAKNINQRWLGHHRKADVAAWKGVTLSWLAFDGSAELLDEIERACIEYFNPVLNGGSAVHGPIGLMVRLPADLHAEVVGISKGSTTRPATSLNSAVVFLLRAGLAALKRSERSENEPGQWVPELLETV